MTDNLEKVVEPSNVVELPDNIKPEDFPDLLEKTLITFNNGDVIEGTIVRILALAAWFPKGKCMKIVRKIDEPTQSTVSGESNSNSNQCISFCKLVRKRSF